MQGASSRSRGGAIRARCAIACAWAILLAAGGARAGSIEGRVYVDVDGDGLLSAGDPTVPGLRVAWETAHFATTDADGRYQLDVPGVDGIVWVRVPDGFRPGPVWAAAPAAGGEIDLPLVAEEAPAEVTFVVGADLHIGKPEFGREQALDEDELLDSLLQAIAVEPAPRFIALTGDLAQSNQPEQYAILAQVASVLPVALVPVPGNHDWYDGGESYRAALGPPTYSFDCGGARFVVLNDNSSVPGAWADFLASDLADNTAPVVAFVHRPPEDRELDLLEAAGVDYLFTGHWHSNGVFRRGDLLQLNTEPMVRGGVDGTPAGYRVVTMSEVGLATAHRAVVEQPVLEVVSPARNQCVSERTVDVVVAFEPGDAVRRVSALGAGGSVDLAHAGGWNWVGRVDVGDGDELRIEAVTGTGLVASAVQPLQRCECSAAAAPGEWPQLQGGPLHRGAVGARIAPPLLTRWTAVVGGHPSAPPIAADGRVFVSVADLDVGAGGGVVALDLETGARLWRFAPGEDVRGAVAVVDGVVAVAGASGTVHVVDASSGAPLWSRDLGAGLPINTTVLHAAPTVVDGIVYIGVQRNLAAIDLHTGEVMWRGDPAPDGIWLSTRAAVAMAEGLVVGSVARGTSGAFAWDRFDGGERWRLAGPDSTGIQASPVVGDGLVYMANASSQVMAVEPATGVERWRHTLLDGAGNWDYAVMATPALAGGLLVVPTMLDDLVALDAATGAERWRLRAGDGALHDAHARTRSASFPSPPIATGDVVWSAGGDGLLRAIDLDSGRLRWSFALGVPGHGGVSAAGDQLLIATFDGTVRAMVHDSCGVNRTEGGGCASGGRPAQAWLAVLAAILFAAGRARRRSSRPAR
jgi:outer membrane protein assembly factor BamB